jgi:SAM-dependent methyltransferase
VSAPHWDEVYRSRGADEVSWFQPSPVVSLELIAASGVSLEAPVIDVGAGASTLVDGLLARGHRDITLLDVAASAFAPTRTRLGPSAPGVRFIVADVTTWKPERTYGLWHDRAALHFLRERAERDAYRAALTTALRPGGKAIVATFAMDGPERCSGLPVQRYSVESLAGELGADGTFRLVDSRHEAHRTPAGAIQSFVYVLLEKC